MTADPVMAEVERWGRISRWHYQRVRYGSRLRAWWACLVEWVRG